MWVKVPPTRLRYDSLPAHADQTRFLESACKLYRREPPVSFAASAGNRAQTDIRCGVTLVLMGSSYGETEPIKATDVEAGHNCKTRLYWS